MCSSAVPNGQLAGCAGWSLDCQVRPPSWDAIARKRPNVLAPGWLPMGEVTTPAPMLPSGSGHSTGQGE